MVIEHKEKLVNDKAALELLQSEAHDTLTDYKVQISLIDQKLADLGKPEVTAEFLDKIYETILEGVENIDLEDGLDCDFEIDYDNRVTMSNTSFSDNGKIADAIYCEVEKLFAEIRSEE
jgi:hypothetical protein